MDAIELNSDSVGDPTRFVALAELERGLAALPPLPGDAGSVALIVRRRTKMNGRREIVNEVELSPEWGVAGDRWEEHKEGGPDAQVAAVQVDVANLIANGQSLALFGDSLFLSIDLARENLPELSQLQVGEAVLDVSILPHNGCLKFKARFGQDALRFVSMHAYRHRNLRGIYMRVIKPGRVRAGDPVQVLKRNQHI